MFGPMNILDKIKAYKLDDIAARKLAVPLSVVEANAIAPPPHAVLHKS